MMLPNFAFSAEYRGADPAFDGFDEYLRIEFANRHPGWEPRFGTVTWFDPAANRYDYAYLLTGNVPEARSQADAEKTVRELLNDIAKGLRALRPKADKAFPKPVTQVWRRRPS